MYTLIAFLWVWHSDEKGKDKEDSIQMSWKSMIFFLRPDIIKVWFFLQMNHHFLLIQSESESCSVMSESLWPHRVYTVHEILQARILERVAIPYSRESSQLRD